jgi:hypothetical protein
MIHRRQNKIANTELTVQFIEKGSDSLGTFQAILSAIASPSDSLSIILNGATLVATVTNVSAILQPIRIETNFLLATSVLAKITMDWKDPNRKVQTTDSH